MRLLIGDGDAVTRGRARRALLAPGVQVSEACDADEVIAALDQGPADAVLLSNRLAQPGACLDMLVDRYPQIPAVVVAVDFDRAQMEDVLRRGASGYISLGDDLTQLPVQLRAVLEFGDSYAVCSERPEDTAICESR